jgi:nucleoside-diphosphate-sugar epimerase
LAHYVITGTAGFIAARVAELLTQAGHTVTGIDNLNDAYDVRLKHWRLSRLQALAGFHFHQLDVSDRAALEAFWHGLPQVDAVLNLAARAGVRQSVDNPWVYFDTNVTGTLNLLDCCRRANVPKFVLASSSSVYGAGSDLPYHENANTDQPLSPYAASKKAAEALCYSYHCLHGIDITVLRYFTVYGPAGRPDMSPFRFVQWISEGRPVMIFGDGRQRRDFTYVDDIAAGTIASLRPLGYEIINLGSDHPVALMDIIHLIESLTGRKAQLEFRPAHSADVPATWANIRRAGELLNWSPQSSIEAGFGELYAWYRANQPWASQISTT